MSHQSIPELGPHVIVADRGRGAARIRQAPHARGTRRQASVALVSGLLGPPVGEWEDAQVWTSALAPSATMGNSPVDGASGTLPTKSNREILASAVAAGVGELRRPTLGLFVAALAAGLEVGFGPLLIAVLMTLTPSASDFLGGRVLIGLLYSFGFIIVVVGRSELFTEHTSMIVFPVLTRAERPLRLLRTWMVVLSANLIGTAIFAWLVILVVVPLGSASSDAFASLGLQLVRHSWLVIFGSAVLAGWLMGLVAWMVASARDTISQVTLVAMLTSAIGFAKLHHSIAGSVEVLAAWFVGALGLTDYLHFQIPAVLGNAVGGLVFVAIMRFGHASRVA